MVAQSQHSPNAPLAGKVIATLESRRAQELSSLISRHGGTPYSAPALREVTLDNREDVRAFIERLIVGDVSMIIFLTGVGARTLLDMAATIGRHEALLQALNSMTVVARGPKPVAVLKQHAVHIDLVPPEPNTSQELLALLRPLDLRGKVVAIQHYGEPNVFLRDALLDLGAELLEVSLYRWELPEDQGPLSQFLEDVQRGSIDVVAATSQAQVRNLFTLAEHFGQEKALRDVLNGAVVVAAVGPVAARAWQERGVTTQIVPEHPKMGHLILAIAEHFQRRHTKEAHPAL